MTRWQSWLQDRVLGRVLKNSSYLLASYVIGAVLTLLTARLLGVASFGVLGAITVFVANVNRLFSFKMGEVVVKYVGEALEREQPQRAAAVVKASFLAEALTSLAAFGVLVLLAPLGARYVTKDPQTVGLFLFYGFSILTGLCAESATGVLQITDHYRSQALLNLLQTAVVALLLGVAAVYHLGIWPVMGIYLAGKAILGLGALGAALYWLPRALGADWLHAPFSALPPRREMLRFALNTNFHGTVTMVARDNEVPVVSFFFGPAAAGYYKIALALINMVVQPINPLIATTYPAITRAFTGGHWQRLKTLLTRVSLLSMGWTVTVALGLALLGRQILFRPWQLFGTRVELLTAYEPALGLVFILLAGYGAASILFWNRPLLLAQGDAAFPFRISFWAMLVKVVLTVLLLPGGQVWMAAALLSAYLLVTVGLVAARGLQGVERARSAAQPVRQAGA